MKFFNRKHKQQTRVMVSFKHGGQFDEKLPMEVIAILPGMEFQTGIVCDMLWDGKTLIREYKWKAGYTVEYDYVYEE